MNVYAPLGLFVLVAIIYLLATRDAEAGEPIGFKVNYFAKPGLPDIPFSELFDKWAQEFDVPWRIMVAIVAHESNFNPKAVNEEAAADARRARDVDSLGLGQILWPDTAQALDGSLIRADLFDPDTNLRLTGMVLKGVLKRFPERDEDDFPFRAVSAYNGGVPKTDPTKYNNLAYVAAVKKQWERYA